MKHQPHSKQFTDFDHGWLRSMRISPHDICQTCDGRKYDSDGQPCQTCGRLGIVKTAKHKSTCQADGCDCAR